MKFALALVFGLFTFSALQAGTIVLEGKYQQKNLYVINGIAPEGVGFCVFEVTVNGDVTSDEVNSSAFEIDLSIFGLKLGDNVVIAIKYKDGCDPRVLNPGALEPRPSFDATDIRVSDSGLLTWETVNEQGGLPYLVQQFKWNKWVTVGEVMGKGTSTKNAYSFQTTQVSGTNKFRVVQKSAEGKLRSSDAVGYESSRDAVSFTYDRRAVGIIFSAETNYELYNAYGQIIKRGFGTTADLSNLPKGDYYISYDSTTGKFSHK